MSTGGINSFGTLPATTPTPGVDAGTVAPAGGLVDDGLGRSAAAATGFAAATAEQQLTADTALAIAARQNVGNPLVATPAAAAPAGPAAWSDEWAKAFRDAGAPAEVIQQLQFTGANGADAARLGEMLAQVKAEVDTQLAKFAAEHPEEFKKFRAAPADKMDRSQLAQIAAAVNAGQVTDEQLEAAAKQASMTGFDTVKDMLLPFLAWSLIPGYGVLRVAASPFTGGKDPITGEKIKLDFWNNGFQGWMDALMFAGGVVQLGTMAAGVGQVMSGHRMIGRAGSDAAVIAANEGVANLKGFDKVLSYLPGTNSNRVITGISRLGDDLSGGLSRLGGVERELAQNVVDQWKAGKISVLGDGSVKLTKMGFQPNARGSLPMIGMRGKSMTAVAHLQGRTALTLDPRMMGKTLAAHFASAGVDFADDALKLKLLQRAGFAPGANVGMLNETVAKALRTDVLGRASQQLLDAGYIARPGGLGGLWGMWRPGPLQDAIKAADAVKNGTVANPGWWSGLSLAGKAGVVIGGGGLAAGAGYFGFVKPQLDAAKAAAQEGAAPAPGADGQTPPQLHAALQQFAALPVEQQQALLQEQYAQLQQAAAQPNLTPEMEQQITAAAKEFELFLEVANQSAAAAQAGGTAGVAPAAGTGTAPAAWSGLAPVAGPGLAPAGPALAPAGGAAPQGLTPQGMGLATP